MLSRNEIVFTAVAAAVLTWLTLKVLVPYLINLVGGLGVEVPFASFAMKHPQATALLFHLVPWATAFLVIAFVIALCVRLAR